MRRCVARLFILGALGLGCAHTDGSPSPAAFAGVTRGYEQSIDVREVPPAAFVDPNRQSKIAAVLPKLHDIVAQIVATDELIGLAVGVVVDGELVFGEGFGVRHADQGGAVDTRTAFRIGSITKVFTAMAALRLWEQGKLDLDRPAADTLPELHTLVYPNTDARPLSVRDILTHTAGLPRDPDLPPLAPGEVRTREAVMQSIDGLSLVRPPGVAYEYSNLGFALLGHVIAAAAGQPFDAAIQDAVLGPLGMTHTVWEPDEVTPSRLASGHVVGDGKIYVRLPRRHGALGAAGGLLSTVEDLARFVAFQLDAWPPRDDDDAGPLARTTVREAQRIRAIRSFRARTAPVELAAAGVEGGAFGVGAAWAVTHSCEHAYIVGHNGAVEGYQATVRLLPYTGIGIIVLGNANWTDTDHVAAQLQKALAAGGALGLRVPQPLPELTATAQKIMDLFTDWDEPTFAAWSTHALSGAQAAARVARNMRWLHDELGDCTLGPLKRATGPWSGEYLAQCEHGDAELTLTLTSASAPKVANVSLDWLNGVPSAEVHEAAVAAAPLLEKFDAAAFHARFSPGYGRTALEQMLAQVRFEHGVCRLDQALEVRGPTDATYALDCDRGSAKLSIGLDRGKPARIVTFQVVSTGPVPVCR